MGKDVCDLCLDVLNKGSSVESINKTVIALIPKCKNATRVSEYRPISLCNVIYKLISKTLANRLKGVLDFFISPTQSAFVPGRNICDNAILGFECLHYIKNKKKGKEGWAALKLDMSKAYDRVELFFLLRSL